MSGELHQAALDGDLAAVILLLEQNANPLEPNAETGQYPLFCALELPLHASPDLKAQKAQIFALLLPYYSDLTEFRDPSGETVIHYVAKYGYDSIIQNLKENAAPDYSLFFMENNFGQRPIHFAIINKKKLSFDGLLQIPNMSTVIDWNGQNLIHHIAHYGTPAMLRTYFTANKDVSSFINAHNSDGNTPAKVAIEFNTTSNVDEMMDVLEEHGAIKAVRTLSPFGR